MVDNSFCTIIGTEIQESIVKNQEEMKKESIFSKLHEFFERQELKYEKNRAEKLIELYERTGIVYDKDFREPIHVSDFYLGVFPRTTEATEFNKKEYDRMEEIFKKSGELRSKKEKDELLTEIVMLGL